MACDLGSLIYLVMPYLQKSGNYHAALCPIVSAISHADKMNLKLEQSKGIIMWSDVVLHLQQQPTTTSQLPHPATDDDDQGKPVTTSWVFNKIKQHHLFDLPGLHSSPILAADLLLVVARCRILDLFSPNHLNHPDQVYEVFDLFGWIDKRELLFHFLLLRDPASSFATRENLDG